MKILQGGAPKCGNFWLHTILDQILHRSGLSQPSFISQQPIYKLAKEWELNYPSQASIDVLEITDLQNRYRISSIFHMPIDKIEDYVANSHHVWTHSPICKKSGEVFELFEKKVYIIRDPRDRAISAANYYCSDYMLKYFPQEEKDPKIYLQKNFDALIQEWVWHVFDHLRYASKFDIHIVFYEGFLLNFKQELSHLLEYLEIDLKYSEQEELKAAVSFDQLQKKNSKHLKKGTSGYWKHQLKKEQKERAEAVAGPLLRCLGYSEDQDKNLPEINKNIDFQELRQELTKAQKVI